MPRWKIWSGSIPDSKTGLITDFLIYCPSQAWMVNGSLENLSPQGDSFLGNAGRECNGVASLLELANMMTFKTWSLQAIEILLPQVLVGVFGRQDMIANYQNAMCHGPDRLVLSASAGDAMILSMQVGSTRTSDAQRDLSHNGAPPNITFGGGPVSRRFPPLCRFPGHTPAQDARCLAVGKRDISLPISATMIAAAMALMQGIV